MIKIRQSCFETNSSSTHSMIITNEYTSPGNSVYFDTGFYGWQQAIYSTTAEKASYFYTAACDLLGRDVRDDICNLLKPYGIQCKFRNDLKFNSYECDGKTIQYLDWDIGYIDHSDGCDEFVNALMNDAELLIRFLFNDDSFVVTGNDNIDEDEEEWEWQRNAESVDYPHIEFYKGN